MNDTKSEGEAYFQFVDYLALVCIAPFEDSPVLGKVACDFFTCWLELVEQRLEGAK